MDEVESRHALDRAIRKSGENYVSISRLLGRNPTYIQQYIKRGIPRRLDETTLRRIARQLGISVADIGGDPDTAFAIRSNTAEIPLPTDFVRLEPLHPGQDETSMAFDARWISGLASRCIRELALLRVEGDSMLPALGPGDQLLIDRADAGQRLRDGLYALRIEGAVIVKRVAVNPARRRVTIQSDNPAYPAWDDCEPGCLEIVGRVVWAGRRFR